MAEPLAQRLRPRSLMRYGGQRHPLARGKVFCRTIDSGRVPNMIFTGRPALENDGGQNYCGGQRNAPAQAERHLRLDQ